MKTKVKDFVQECPALVLMMVNSTPLPWPGLTVQGSTYQEMFSGCGPAINKNTP